MCERCQEQFLVIFVCLPVCVSHRGRKREFSSQSCWTQGNQKSCGHSDISSQFSERTYDWCSRAVQSFQSDLEWGQEPQSQGLIPANMFLFWILDRKSVFPIIVTSSIFTFQRNSWTAIHPCTRLNLKSSTTTQLNKKLMILNPSLFWSLLNCQQVR